IPIKRVTLDYFINSVELGEGESFSVSTEGKNLTILIKSTLDNNALVEWFLSHLRSGEKSTLKIYGKAFLDLIVLEYGIPIELERKIETEILSSFKIALEERIGPARIKAESEKVTLDESKLIVPVIVRNENSFPIYFGTTEYALRMNEIEVASGTQEHGLLLPPNSASRIVFVLELNKEKLKEWWVLHVKNGERTRLEITISPCLEILGSKYCFKLCEYSYGFRTNFL
ncbi:MAG: LEA type 2 family protein, partial [Archaeoglobaceae archaeon]